MEENRYILIVDDEKDFTESVFFWLKTKGYNVKVAHSGNEALEILKTEEPRVIFLDINMPEMDGIETLRRIRKMNQQIPVVMITAAYNDERIEACRKLGISGFFPKEGSLEELVNVLEVTIRRHK